MIPFDFDYYRPDTLSQAVNTFKKLDAAGASPVYYAGGTELISMARADSLCFKAVIDIKSIPECCVLFCDGQRLSIGSAVTLTRIAESGVFPLLRDTVSKIADHTVQGKVTIGGNLAGTIIYREAALPLMLSDCRVSVMRESGLVELPFLSVFNGRLLLRKDEFIVSFSVDKRYTSLAYGHAKVTKSVKIDYPLVTLAVIKDGGKISAAVSGFADCPMLLPGEALNDRALTVSERIENTVRAVQISVLSDLSGSGEYRMFVLKNTLADIAAKLGVV